MAWVKMEGSGSEYSNRVGYQRLPYKTLMKINAANISIERAAAGHPDVIQNVMTEDQAEVAMANIRAANRGQAVRPQNVTGVFTRGKIVRHKPSGAKVTIMQASVAKKNGERMHEVIDASTGRRFLAKESNLRILS